MEAIIRTVSGAQLQTCDLLGIPYPSNPKRTLNTKFGIRANAVLVDTARPTISYITIGNGGHQMVMGANNLYKPEVIQHIPKHAALYNHLPFILRKADDDISNDQRKNYRLRRLETIDGVDYIAYYAMLLNKTDTVSQLELRTVKDGVITTQPFVSEDVDLTDPFSTKPFIPSTGVITTSGDYVACTAKVPWTLGTWEIQELLNAANILYKDDSFAIISEVALCSGVDDPTSTSYGDVTITYNEAIAVEVFSFISTFFAAKFSNNSINMQLDVGSLEPMLNLS